MESTKQSVKTVIKHTKKRRCRRHCRRHRSTRNIHQKIELNKQDFQCVINLNTTICEHEASRSELNTTICDCVSHRSNRKSHQASSVNRESRRVSSLNQEPSSLETQCNSRGRITPYCFREKCQSSVQKCRCRDERQDHVNMMAKHHHYSSNRNHRRASTGAKRLRDRHRKHRNDTLKLSPISSSPLKDDLNHLYEDISNDSLDEFLKTPISYKNIRYIEDKVESKLDTLIRRTKERERKLVAESRNKRSYSISTSSNISSGDCPMDLETLDSVSLASRTTLVLENSQFDCIYLSSEVEKSPEYSQSDLNVKKYKYGLCSPGSSSKTNKHMNPPIKYECAQVNSPGSLSQSYFITNDPKKHTYRRLCSPGPSSQSDLNINLPRKYECEEIYSPGSPIQVDFIKNDPKKYEYRRVCSPEPLSKNYLNKNILKKCEHKQRYSPESPLQDDFLKIIPKKHEYSQLCSPGPSSKNDFNMSILKKCEHKQGYSPGSPLQGDVIADFGKKHESNFKIVYIKAEPMDIGAYSPTFDYSKEEIKKEIKVKSEP